MALRLMMEAVPFEFRPRVVGSSAQADTRPYPAWTPILKYYVLHRLDAFSGSMGSASAHLPKLVTGVKFADGIEVVAQPAARQAKAV
jgi:hypothetical protein